MPAALVREGDPVSPEDELVGISSGQVLPCRDQGAAMLSAGQRQLERAKTRLPLSEAMVRRLRLHEEQADIEAAGRIARAEGRLAGGMRQKLALGRRLVWAPKILLLDEPAAGVDPVSRRELRDASANLAGPGITIVVATTCLDEDERCSRVACLDDGAVLAIDAPAVLQSSRASGLGRYSRMLSFPGCGPDERSTTRTRCRIAANPNRPPRATTPLYRWQA